MLRIVGSLFSIGLDRLVAIRRVVEGLHLDVVETQARGACASMLLPMYGASRVDSCGSTRKRWMNVG